MSSSSSANESRSISRAVVVQALCTQARVINALILRETKGRYGDYKIGFLWALIEPLFLVLGFVLAFAYTSSGTMSGMPIALFMITGIAPFLIFRNPMTQMQTAITANKSLLAFPQVTTFDVVLARAILEIAVMSFVFIILLVMARLVGIPIRVESPLGVLAACTLLATISAGFGFMFAVIAPIIPAMKQVTSVAMGRPLFMASGLFFTAESIPAPLRDWLLYNPLLHMLELLRSTFFREFETDHGDWLYATSWAVGTLALGLLFHRALQRKAVVSL